MPKVIAAILLLQSGGVDSSRPPTVTAVRVDRAPVVDGRLDDPEWNLAPAVTDFRQTDPDEGAPVSEATAVRVLYDGTAVRSEEHTSELQSHSDLVCRLLLE